MSNNENLKPQVIDFCLNFINDRDRQVLKSDLCRHAQNEFEQQLTERNDEVDGDGGWFIESLVGKLTIDYKFTYTAEEGKEIAISSLGEEVLSKGGYNKWLQSVEEARREKEKAEAQERKWNTRNSVSSCVLSVATTAAIVWGWVCPEQGSKTLPVLTFIAGCLLGYAVNNLRRNRRLRRHTANQ